ncbi:hypothetical protein [Spirillospora sp. CA-128828]|uniref:hypothetical protein n=1 Tax=Spirillospora sp. CA-128828 TaxID=3240033 RepID=UPI003D8D5C99
MSKHGQQITWERLHALGIHFVPPVDSPSYVEELDAKLERATHLFVVGKFETGQPPSVHLVTESGALNLDELREVKSLTGRGPVLGWAKRYRQPLNRLSWYARWMILHWDFRGRDHQVRADELGQLRKSSGTRGLSLNELNALRKIINRFRGRGNNVEELLYKHYGRDDQGEVGANFGPYRTLLRWKTQPPLPHSRDPRLREIVVASVVTTATSPEVK